MKLKSILRSFVSLFFPKLCIICKEPLCGDEEFLCLECLFRIPVTGYHLSETNQTKDRFLGKIPVKKAASWLYYYKGGVGQQLIAEIKYRENTGLGFWVGKKYAEELHSNGFFEDIDLIVPIPLHLSKKRKRGFNQSEIIAKGIAEICGLSIETKNLQRIKANTTQTKKGFYDRWLNTREVFHVIDETAFSDKHVLLVDDVLTTGSTLENAASCLLEIKKCSVSILTITIAQ